MYRDKLIRQLEASLKEIRYQQQRYKTKVAELEREEDMTLLAIKDLRKQLEGDTH